MKTGTSLHQKTPANTKSIKTIPHGVNGALFRACQQRKMEQNTEQTTEQNTVNVNTPARPVFQKTG